MKDICYKCGVVQEYGTMKDIDEVSFEILCNYCYNMNANNLLDKNMTIDKAKNILRNSGYYVLDEVMKNVVKILYFFGIVVAIIYISILMMSGIYLLIEK